MRLILRVNDIDQLGYNVNGYQQKSSSTVTNSVGSANAMRSVLTFNLNLTDFFSTIKDTFTLRFLGIYGISLQPSTNIIDYSSHPALRTSNLWLKGLETINGQNEIMLGQFTNFNPNEELTFENVFFLIGNAGDFVHYYDFNRINVGDQTANFYRFLMSNVQEFSSSNSLVRYRFNSSAISQLNNKIVRGGRPSLQSFGGNNFFMSVTEAGDGTNPIGARVEQANGNVTITVLPENNQWFMKRFSDNVPFETPSLDLTMFSPSDPSNIQLTFELRDLLSNKIQPVVDSVNKVYPSFNIVLELF